jgi:hypothetical protein
MKAEMRPNTPHGGPKSEEGKAVSRMNALAHGILRETLTPYEADMELGLLEKLRDENAPSSALEDILLERIALNYVKLRRVSKAESEYIQSALDPRIVKINPVFDMSLKMEKVVSEGYTPKVGTTTIERLLTVYGRYETNLENRLFRAIRELRALKTQKAT